MSAYIVTPNPHIASPRTTQKIMLDVLIALVPALIAATIFFGPRALFITGLTVISCVGFEYLMRRLMKRQQTISDLSAVVTGVILAFNLPVTVPVWLPIIGSAVAIIFVKQLFGGIGQNFANPAITARVVLFISFAVRMTDWVAPFYYTDAISVVSSASTTEGVDVVSIATPLQDIASASTLDLFLGSVGGCLGETSALALLIGGVYLVVRKVISPIIPVAFMGTVFVLTALLGENPVNQLFAGGLMIGAIFMATDYATSPMTNKGKVIFAFGCGLLTVGIRVFGNYPEGVSFAILFMNVVCPLIDRYVKTKPFGAIEKKKGAA